MRFANKIAILGLLFISLSFYSDAEKESLASGNGFYIVVQDHYIDKSHKFFVESKDSVNIIFNTIFESEMELGKIDRPVRINNGKYDFYVARVNLFTKSNGNIGFKNLKYPALEIDAEALERNNKLIEINSEAVKRRNKVDVMDM